MIQKIIHQMWISHPLHTPRLLPQRYSAFIQAWIDLHPKWEIILWGNEIFDHYKDNLTLQRMLEDPKIDEAQLTDLLRFLVLREFGGLYADVDVQPFKRFDRLTELATTAVLGTLAPCDRGYTWMDPSVCLFNKDHPALTLIIEDYFSKSYAPRCGVLMNLLTNELDETYTILGYRAFFGHIHYPDAYCLHWPHRLKSWG